MRQRLYLAIYRLGRGGRFGDGGEIPSMAMAVSRQ
jgi:hypothetical protein